MGPLSHQEILSWSTLRAVNIAPSEVDALRQIDRAFRNYHADKTKPPVPLPPSRALADAAAIAQAERKAHKQKGG